MDINKEEIYQEARADTLSHFSDDELKQGACLYWARATGTALLKRRIGPVRLQAGTMLWRTVPPHEDDGQKATHFGYEWSPNEPFSQAAIAEGRLPEMHIWIGLPQTGEVVDFSTGYLRDVAERRHGITWRTPRPPKFVWATKDEMPDGVVYRAEPEAIMFALRFIQEKLMKEAA